MQGRKTRRVILGILFWAGRCIFSDISANDEPPLFCFNCFITASSPALLNPILLIKPWSSLRRKDVFGVSRLGFWSNRSNFYKTKSKLANSLYNTAFCQIQPQGQQDFQTLGQKIHVAKQGVYLKHTP